MGALKFPEIKRSMLSDKVAVHLLDMIAKGELKPGEKLPPERELAKALNIGRPALREALSALHMMNVIEIKQGDGVYVSSLSPDILIKPFEVFAALADLEMLALFEIREILEVGIAGMAAQRISDEEIEELHRCLSRLRETTGNSAEFVRLDEELHAIITRSCRNPLLISVMISISSLSHLSRQVAVLFPTFNDQVLTDHEQIVAALETRDVIKSKEAMQAHLSHVREMTEWIERGEIKGFEWQNLSQAPPEAKAAVERLFQTKKARFLPTMHPE